MRLMESYCSEHNARMVAMQAANDSAQAMIHSLLSGVQPGAPGGDHAGDHARLLPKRKRRRRRSERTEKECRKGVRRSMNTLRGEIVQVSGTGRRRRIRRRQTCPISRTRLRSTSGRKDAVSWKLRSISVRIRCAASCLLPATDFIKIWK